MTVPSPIVLLPEEVRSRLFSAQEIVTPEDVVEGLLRNALDADAHTIAIELELEKGHISVHDDGIGIDEFEFSQNGHLAKQYCTSKFNSPSPSYGTQGRFLASLSSLSLLSITSKQRGCPHANRLILHRGRAISRHSRLGGADTGLRRGGTHVDVRNLFGEIPVRAKHLSLRYSSPVEADKTYDRIKKTLVGYLLARKRAARFRLSLKFGKRLYVHHEPNLPDPDHLALDPVISTLFQAGLVADAMSASWRLASIQTSELCIHAALSTVSAPSKSIQFVSIGHLPLFFSKHENWLFDIINEAFQSSNFGAVGNHEDPAVSTTGCPKPPLRPRPGLKLAKGVDRWPMFYIRIDTKPEKVTQLLQSSNVRSGPENGLEYFTNALQSLIHEFLNANGFKRGCPTKGRYRGSAGELFGKKLSVTNTGQSLVVDRAKAAKAAGPLTHWPRVKSGHQYSQDDIAYGIGSSTLTEKVGDVGRSTPVEQDDTGEQRQSQETSRATSCEATNAGAVQWTNPRNGRILRLHPRTGALLPICDASKPQTPSTWSSASDHSTMLKQARGSISQDDSDAKHDPAVKLQKYKTLLALCKTEMSIPSVASADADIPSGPRCSTEALEVCASASRIPTKEALAGARVIGQVDQKYLLAVIPATIASPRRGKSTCLVILVDQHAADERVRFERLCEEACQAATTSLAKPMIFEVDDNEVMLFETRQEYFGRWGIKYTVTVRSGSSNAASLVEIDSLPPLVVERCRTDPKLLIDLLRGGIWSESCKPSGVYGEDVNEQESKQEVTWVSELAHCPSLMMEMVKSRACRTAIMFNDPLTMDDCIDLVQRLSKCILPFQCAHGRPTVTVLGEIDEDPNDMCPLIDQEDGFGAISGDIGFRAAWDSWIKAG